VDQGNELAKADSTIQQYRTLWQDTQLQLNQAIKRSDRGLSLPEKIIGVSLLVVAIVK